MSEQVYFIIAVALSIINGILLCFMAYKFLHTYQLNGYHMGRLMNWFKNTNGKFFLRLTFLTLLSLGGLLVTNVLFNSYGHGFLSLIGMIFYFVFVIVFIVYESKIPKKKPIVFTARMRRLYVLLFLLCTALTMGMFYITYDITVLGDMYMTLRYSIIAISPIIMPIMVVIVAHILLPFELLNNSRYVVRATKKLAENKSLIKIGITGSFAKTSVKEILSAMLTKKFNTLATQESYNTPMGICKSVKKLKSTHEVFIAEMGARNPGQIRELCNIVHPNYAIITGIGNQHLETFRTVENIISTKSELINVITPKGFVVINGDSKLAREMKPKNNAVPIYYTGLGEKDNITAKNIRAERNGNEFDLVVDDNTIHCSTKLLGIHNISNILVCVAVAYKLGVTLPDISQAIAELKPPSHRLEMIKYTNGITVIDDTFNANVEGTKAALATIKMFEGRKVIITPGLVELGAKEKSANYEFGIDIASVCGLVVLIGAIRTTPIKEGLLASGYDKENIKIYNSLYDAKRDFKNFLTIGDVVLLENDLPDDYNEVEPLK